MGYCTAADVSKGSQITYDQFIENTFANQIALESWITSTVIPWAQVLIDDFCGRDFTKHSSQTEYLDGTGKDRIFPAHSPILAVSSLSRNSDYLGKGSWTAESTSDYQAYDAYIILRAGFNEGYKNYKLIYDYGYESVPSTVANVCIEICTKILQYMVINKMGPLLPSGGPFGTIKQIIPEREIFPDTLKKLLASYVKLRFQTVG